MDSGPGAHPREQQKLSLIHSECKFQITIFCQQKVLRIFRVHAVNSREQTMSQAVAYKRLKTMDNYKTVTPTVAEPYER